MGVHDRDWYWEHQQKQSGCGRGAANPATSFPVQIATGVALGIVTAALLIWLTFEWRARQAAEEAHRAAQQFLAEQKRIQEQATRQEALINARQSAAVQAHRQAMANQQRMIEQAKRAQLDARDSKEKAWGRFYKKPAGCDETAGGSWTVECANDREPTRFPTPSADRFSR